MNIETRVGLFVLIGLAVAAVGIMKLTDVRWESRYTLYFIFDDVQGIRDKSPVKISGVEVGRVEKIELVEGKARVKARISREVAIYNNAKVRVKLIGLIGSQFLELKPGDSTLQRLRDGDTVRGDPPRSINDLVDKLADLIEGKDGKGGIGKDLQVTMSNLRSVSDALNHAIGMQKVELEQMVSNFNQFSGDLKGMAKDMHELTSENKENFTTSMAKLRSLLERADEVMAKVQKGDGAFARLVSDKEVGDEVKKTVSNLKQTSESAREMLARFTKMRSFWEFQFRGVPGASTVRGDGGVRLQPRDFKYYYIGVNNAGDRKDEFKNDGDYEKKSTITGILGKEFGPMTVELGAIRSSAGIGLKYYPFHRNFEKEEEREETRKLSIEAQAFEFGRNETRGRAGQERKFSNPQFNLGAKYKVSKWTRVGASIEDLAEVRQYNVLTQLVFEDRDLAYLFGFVSFAR